jgi:hypothetical protein
VKKISKILVLLSLVILTVSITSQEAFGQATQQELAYDDGVFETGSTQDPPYEFGVRFSIPDTWEEAEIVKIRYYLWRDVDYFRIYVYDERALPTDDSRLITIGASGVEGWNEYALDHDLIVSDDFYIAVEMFSFNNPSIGADETAPAESRSYIRSSSSVAWTLKDNCDWGLRAVVEEVTPVHFVVPEVPLGTVATLTSMMIALIGYAGYKRHKTKQ